LWFIENFEQIVVARFYERNRFLTIRLNARQDWEIPQATYGKHGISLLKK